MAPANEVSKKRKPKVGKGLRNSPNDENSFLAQTHTSRLVREGGWRYYLSRVVVEFRGRGVFE
jgi:hypothetical protein